MKELQAIRRSTSFLENKIQCYQNEGRKPWINFEEEEDNGQHKFSKPDGQLDSIGGSVANGREEEAIAHPNKAWMDNDMIRT